MNKTLGTVLVVILVIATAGAYLYPKVSPVAEPRVGANPGPDSQSECTSQNGLITCSTNKGLTLASTTCSIRSPNATSTLVFGSLQVASTSAAAALIEMGKSVSPNATTTLIGGVTVAAGAQATIIASTSPSGAGLNPTVVFAPNTYFNVKNGSGVFQFGGTCTAQFIVN